MKKFILRTLAVIVLIVAVLVVNTIWFKPFFIRAFYERVWLLQNGRSGLLLYS